MPTITYQHVPASGEAHCDESVIICALGSAANIQAGKVSVLDIVCCQCLAWNKKCIVRSHLEVKHHHYSRSLFILSGSVKKSEICEGDCGVVKSHGTFTLHVFYIIAITKHYVRGTLAMKCCRISTGKKKSVSKYVLYQRHILTVNKGRTRLLQWPSDALWRRSQAVKLGTQSERYRRLLEVSCRRCFVTVDVSWPRICRSTRLQRHIPSQAVDTSVTTSERICTLRGDEWPGSQPPR